MAATLSSKFRAFRTAKLEREQVAKAAAYHWIEEGSDEDFKRNIMESDVDPYIPATPGEWRALQGVPDRFVVQIDLADIEVRIASMYPQLWGTALAHDQTYRIDFTVTNPIT